MDMLMKLLIMIFLSVMNWVLENKCTSVRNVRQVIKVGWVCGSIPKVNMKVFVIPVNTAGIRQHHKEILNNIKKQSTKV